jgi:hypothetical protein
MPATKGQVMAPPRRTGKSSAKAVDIRATLGAPRVCAVLLAFGALCTLGTSLTGLCAVRPILAYGSAAALVISAVGMLLGWSPARMVARIVCWLDIFLFAMLVVPDREDAVFSGSYGYHTFCGVLAVYFLLCAICLRFSRHRISAATVSPQGRR